MKYTINKGIGRSVEFKGLKAQYLFLFAGGLLAVFVLLVIFYTAGVDQWACIGFGAGAASMLAQKNRRLPYCKQSGASQKTDAVYDR